MAQVSVWRRTDNERIRAMIRSSVRYDTTGVVPSPETMREDVTDKVPSIWSELSTDDEGKFKSLATVPDCWTCADSSKDNRTVALWWASEAHPVMISLLQGYVFIQRYPPCPKEDAVAVRLTLMLQVEDGNFALKKVLSIEFESGEEETTTRKLKQTVMEQDKFPRMWKWLEEEALFLMPFIEADRLLDVWAAHTG